MKPKISCIVMLSLCFLFTQSCGTVQSAPSPAGLPPSPAGLPPSPTGLPLTVAPTEVPATPTAAPPPEPQGPCDNFLYPLRPGNTWVYQSNGANGLARMTFQVTGIEGDLARIHVVDEENGVTTDDTVRCEQGAIVNLPLVYLSLLLSDYLDGVLNTYQNSGVTAPSRLTFTENNWVYSWQVKKLVEQPVKVSPPGTELSGGILRSNVMTLDSHTQGLREAVNVPAGAFSQALLVDSELTSPVTIGGSGGVFKVQYKEWFEPYVGLLKIEAVSGSVDTTGFPVPLPISKTLELVEYHFEQ
ncbi:MAG: hypothetical protein ACOYYJ_05390 [Chloroflexota bacterium]